MAHHRPQPGGHGPWNQSLAIFQNVLEARPISSLQPLVSKYVHVCTCGVLCHFRRFSSSLPLHAIRTSCVTLLGSYRLFPPRSASASQQFLHPTLGPVTRRSRLEKRRDETRRDRLDLVSSRDFVSRDRLEKYFWSRSKKVPSKWQKIKF